MTEPYNRSIFTATAGWIRVEEILGGWNVMREGGKAAAARFKGVDDPSVGLRRALEYVGVRDDEAALLAPAIIAGEEIG